MFVKQNVVRSERAICQDNSTRWWCAINVSTCKDSQQTVAYTIRCAHQTWRCSCHSLDVAVKTSRLTAIEDGMGLGWQWMAICVTFQSPLPRSFSLWKMYCKNTQWECLQTLWHHESMALCPVFWCRYKSEILKNSRKMAFCQLKGLGRLVLRIYEIKKSSLQEYFTNKALKC